MQGLSDDELRERLTELRVEHRDLDEAIERLIEARKEARGRKDWAEADRIRDELDAMGIVLEDKDGQTIWRRA